MARTLEQVFLDICGNMVLQIAHLTVTTEQQADKIQEIEAENAALKAGKQNG